MTLNYIKDLDGLRAIAAFMVIFAHFFSSSIFQDYPIISKIAGLGNSGVSLFFVLSGFVITRILLASINSKTYFKSFYIRRVLRIFPLYYFALLCYYYFPYLALNFNLHIGPDTS
ncbi:MAG: acyltransferase [Agriterribacter sp.]